MKMFRFIGFIGLAFVWSSFLASAHPISPVLTDQENGAVIDRITPHVPNRPHLASGSRTKPVLGRVVVSVGPLKTSPNYSAFLADFREFAKGTVDPTGSPSPKKFIPLGNKLLPGYVTAPPPGSNILMWLGQTNPTGEASAEQGNTLWYAVVYWSDEKFVPANLKFVLDSWPNDLFDKEEVYNDPDLSYSDGSFGQTWDNGVTTTITSGHWNDHDVNVFGFVGSASATMNVTSQSQSDSDASWMLGFANFKETGTWSLMDGNNVLLSVSKTLETHPATVDRPVLKFARSSDGQGNVSAPGFTGTGKLLGSSSITGPWAFVSNVSGSNPVAISDGTGLQFYKLQVD